MLQKSFLSLCNDEDEDKDNYARVAARKALHNMEKKALKDATDE